MRNEVGRWCFDRISPVIGAGTDSRFEILTAVRTWLRCWACMLIYLSAETSALADDAPRFEVLGRDGRRWQGAIVGAVSQSLKVVSDSGQSAALNDIERLEMPAIPQALPDRGWRRLTLINGDRLTAKLHSDAPSDASATRTSQATQFTWTTRLGQSVTLPLSAVWRIEHPPGTRNLVYQDFESDAKGWSNSKGEPTIPQPGQSRSGKSSLRLSADQPRLGYNVSPGLTQGWLEFRFFVEEGDTSRGICEAALRMTGLAGADSIQVQLAGPEAWYGVTAGKKNLPQRQIVPRRTGWHTLSAELQGQLLRLTIDGFPLLDEPISPGRTPQLTGIDLTAHQASPVVWIDDFAVTAAAPESSVPILQMSQDELTLFDRDQLFGNIEGLTTEGVTLEARTDKAVIPWRDIRLMQMAARRTAPRSVKGWIAAIETQPFSSAKPTESADLLQGAVVGLTSEVCVVEHCLLGKLDIPWKSVRKIRPAYFGMSLSIEARPCHFGQEVKSALQMPVPAGVQFSRTFSLQEVPTGTAYLTLVATDLEPAGPGTREHPWLQALRDGELTSELWLNGRRMVVLNAEISGKGLPRQPQRLRIKLPQESLLAGKNVAEVRLMPSRSELGEYDNWEMTDLRLEVEMPVPAGRE